MHIHVHACMYTYIHTCTLVTNTYSISNINYVKLKQVNLTGNAISIFYTVHNSLTKYSQPDHMTYQ